MDDIDAGGRLQLDQDAPGDDEIDTLARYCHSSIMNGDGSFAFKWKPTRMKLEAQRFLIDLFEEAGPKSSVNLNGGSDNVGSNEFCL